MTADDTNLVLEHLKRIQERIGGMERRMDSLELRMTSLDEHMRGVQTSITDLGMRMGHVEKDVSLIKRRLDLVDAE